LFEILSTVFRYIFIVIIYYFVYGIIRLIYLDISTTTHTGKKLSGKDPYLKLINRRESLNFRVEESYFLDGATSLGRSNKNEICIKDPFLSGEHAAFHNKKGAWYVYDLGSKNGTFVNDEQIDSQPYELTDGDTVHLGQVNFIFVDVREV